jgi:hypothetical protein
MDYSRIARFSSIPLSLLFCVAVVTGVSGILRWTELQLTALPEVQARSAAAAQSLAWSQRAGVLGSYPMFPLLPGNVSTSQEGPRHAQPLFSSEKNQVKGKTTAAEPYAAMKAQQNVERIGLPPQGRFTVEVTFKNVGTATWTRIGNDAVQLSIEGASSRLRDPFWRSATIVAMLKEDRVAPGNSGTFRFAVSAPKTQGQLLQTFLLKTARGKVVNGSKVSVVVSVGLFPALFRAQVVSQSHEVVNVEPGRGFPLTVRIKNTGVRPWEATGENRVTVETNRPTSDVHPLQHQFWVSSQRVTTIPKSIPPGEEMDLVIAIQAPEAVGTIDSSFYLSVQKVGLIAGGTIHLQLNVRPKVVMVNPSQPQDFRVGLYRTMDPIFILSTNDYTIADEEGSTLGTVAANGRSVISGSNGVLTVMTPDATFSGAVIRFLPRDQNSILTLENYEQRPSWNPSLNDNQFRGIIEIRWRAASSELSVINELPIEMYLRGIAEASNDEDPEYLKALIIAARTYALYHYNHPTKHVGEYYILGTTEGDQVYRGFGFESRADAVTAAVEATEGMVVTYHDEVVVTPYFSHSDGRTRAWSEVWSGSGYDWLVSVLDPCCTTMTLLGHGVGMSADGARYFVKQGWTFEQVLQYYYTGIKLMDLY